MEYREEDYLSLSGIQHFDFCRRQWALIHIEQQWEENLRTVEGELFHKRAHDTSVNEKRGKTVIVRGMAVSSSALGTSGICDIVEFSPSKQGVTIHGRDGKFQVSPVEYKRGKSKTIDSDRLQLTTQAMCLEEMLCCKIEYGYLFYGETKRREKILICDEFREKVTSYFKEMHSYYKQKYTPKVSMTKSCNACSLKEVCLPKLGKCKSVADYIQKRLGEDL